MKKFLITFSGDESGAVTVDWIVLTAAVVGLGTAAFITATSGISVVTENIKTGVENQPLGTE